MTAVEATKSPEYRSLYANNTALAISTYDFSLIFGEITGAEEGKLQVEQHTKITMSPLHAKVLAKVFSDHVEAYEKQFGEIRIPVGPTENTGKSS
jgi:hypothetical protein